MAKSTLLVLDYLNSGKTFDDLWEDHHVNASTIGLNGKVSLNYDQIEAKNEDELAQQCRGLIIRNVDGIYKAVAVPFYRFFNYGQGSAAIKTQKELIENIIFEKADGTLAIVYYDEFDNHWHVGTRSVPDANVLHSSNLTFRQIFEECARHNVEDVDVLFKSLNRDLTYMFEICSPLNMNVVEYQTPHLVLLGARNTATLQEIHLEELDVPNFAKAKMHKFNSYEEFTSFVEGRPASEGEGVVVLTKDFQRVKVKSLNYVNAHHLASCVGSSPRNMLSVVLNKQEDDVEPILSPYIFGKIKAFKDGFTLLADDIRAAKKKAEEATSDRKSYAIYVKKHFPHYENFLFGLLRYNSMDELICGNKKDGDYTNAFLDNIIRLIEEKKWEGTNN